MCTQTDRVIADTTAKKRVLMKKDRYNDGNKSLESMKIAHTIVELSIPLAGV